MPTFTTAIWGRAIYPGINSVKSCSYTLTHGVTPSLAELIVAPQDDLELETGDLTITDSYGTVTLPDCKIAHHTFQRDSSGRVWRLALFDRRWKWAFGSISGSYNLRDVRGEIIIRTQKKPRDLANLCLDAMGETGYNTSVLDLYDQAKPVVNWDHDPPMHCLADLVEQFGCRVIYDPFFDGVLIAKVGFGADLPDGPIVEGNLAINPPERPDSILIVGAPARFNVYLQLEPVGKDGDGRIKPIDQLSYAPKNGKKWDPPYFDSLLGFTDPGGQAAGVGPAAEIYQDLAKQSVFRWYRITTINQSFDPLDNPAELRIYTKKEASTSVYFKVKRIEQLLPLADTVADTDTLTSNPDFANTPNKARVFGTFYKGSWKWDQNSDITQVYPYEFSINKPDGIVEFADYVFKLDDDFTAAPADLFLFTGVTFKDVDTSALERYENTFTFGTNFGTQPRTIHKDELEIVYEADYDSETFSVKSVKSNINAVAALAQYYFNGAALEYETTTPGERTYGGIIPIVPDGAIQQVTWTVGGPFATTRASRNTEHDWRIPSYTEMRQLQRDKRRNQSAYQAALEASQPKPDSPDDAPR